MTDDTALSLCSLRGKCVNTSLSISNYKLEACHTGPSSIMPGIRAKVSQLSFTPANLKSYQNCRLVQRVCQRLEQ